RETAIGGVRLEYPGTLAAAPGAGFPGNLPWAALFLSGQDEQARLASLGLSRPRVVVLTYEQTAQGLELMPRVTPLSSPAAAIEDAIAGACRATLDRSGFPVFSSWIVFSIFLSFLMPIWSLS